MIQDRQLHLSATKALAWALWAATLALIGAAFVVYHIADDRERAFLVACIGLALSAMAATAHIRSFMCDFSSRLKGAFELGREVEREHQRELRSV